MWLRGYVMKTSILKLSFEGEHEIDLDVLAETLSATVETLEYIANHQLQDDDFCKFKVTSIKEGSFEIIIKQIIEVSPALFDASKPILEVFRQILEIRQLFNGEIPSKDKIVKNGDRTTISANGNTINCDTVVFNTYVGDDRIEKSVAKVSKAVSHDGEHSKLKYEFDKNQTIEFSKEQMINLSNPMDVSVLNDNLETNIMDTDLKVRKPDLVGNSKWQFILNGKNIKADILDEYFLCRVRNNEITFNAKTILRVKLEVRYEEEKIISYKVIKVLKVR